MTLLVVGTPLIPPSNCQQEPSPAGPPTGNDSSPARPPTGNDSAPSPARPPTGDDSAPSPAWLHEMPGAFSEAIRATMPQIIHEIALLQNVCATSLYYLTRPRLIPSPISQTFIKDNIEKVVEQMTMTSESQRADIRDVCIPFLCSHRTNPSVNTSDPTDICGAGDEG